jgi:hypothetical protein
VASWTTPLDPSSSGHDEGRLPGSGTAGPRQAGAPLFAIVAAEAERRARLALRAWVNCPCPSTRTAYVHAISAVNVARACAARGTRSTTEGRRPL